MMPGQNTNRWGEAIKLKVGVWEGVEDVEDEAQIRDGHNICDQKKIVTWEA